MQRYIGIMSGTSLDGVDAALVDLHDSPRLLGTHYVPYESSLRDQLLALHESGADELHRSAMLANELAYAYAEAIRGLLAREKVLPGDITAIGCHGQTIRHRPESGYTIQLNNGALLAELTGIDVIADLRSRDIAAGGQGAPLVPAFHAACFRDPERARAIINIGGIANITRLPSGNDTKTPIMGFDTGPGNLLLDSWARRSLGKTRDEDGRFASTGTVIPELLNQLLSDAYFEQTPPKSTGRDHFNLGWLDHHLSGHVNPQDVQATLAELTARSIADALHQTCPGTREAFVCGGGAHNADLMHRLARCLLRQQPDIVLATTEKLGMHPDWVEAMAFAWLAQRTIQREPGNLPAVTGARGPRILGALYPR